MSRPLRSTRITGLHRYYEPVRQRAAATVLSASQFPPLDALPLTATRLGGGCVGARLPTFHAEAADRAHAASMPGTAWPARRDVRQTHPGTYPSSRFRCHLGSITTRRQRFAHARLPGPHLTRSGRAFSPTLTTTVFS
jgi:hypothetical protein